MVKIYMAAYNTGIGKKIDSAAMHATAIDSLSDTCATTVVLIATLVGHFTGLRIDGWCGVLVGLFILYAGINAAKDTLDPLLGQAPDEELVQQIEDIVMSHPPICGIHDLIVHDYGPGRQMITLHAEVPCEGSMLEIHEVIDTAEHDLRRRLGCDATIHMDPIVTADEHIKELRTEVSDIVKNIDPVISIHDFRVVAGPNRSNLLFDVLVPFKFRLSDDELTADITSKIKEQIGQNYDAIIQVDKAYAAREH
jgi:divalent metal cation (Fe/Co/Zn/Cd) transporter